MFNQRRVNKVSRRFSLLLFLWLVFQIQLADIFFQLPVCECPLALSQLNFWSSVSIVRVFFVGNIACTWIAVSWFGIASQFDISPFAFCETWLWTWRFDLNIHIKLQKTELWKQYIDSCNAIRFWNIAQFVITVVAVISLAMKQFMCIKFHREKDTSPILQEINSNFKECAIFPSRIKTIVSRKFSRIRNAISEPKIGHVTDRCACYHWWPDKPRIVWRYRIDMLLFIYTVCLHLE